MELAEIYGVIMFVKQFVVVLDLNDFFFFLNIVNEGQI
jgi:hypothetical protein